VVIEHAAGDLTCTVEAATTLADLDRELSRADQMLALDPPGAERVTVGEAFDRGLFGPRAHRYGLPRDLVLGIRARLPDGTVIRGGGKVVKNVAGYDLPKLFTGAHGALGELLELTLRLHPRPAQTASLVTPLCDPIPLEPLMPACVEVQLPEERLLVRFESPVAREQAREAQALVGGEIEEDDEALWADHRERQAGLELRRCPPAEAPELAGILIGQGATRIVGRWARGWLFADVAPVAAEPTPLERRVIDRFAVT
jgi:glycolate oxidase FAD binding subunit